MPFITVAPERKLFYELHGTGPIKVLFVHGFATSKGGWDYQTEYFQQNPELLTQFQFVVFDNRGIGLSSSPTTLTEALTTTVRGFSDDVHQLVSHLGWISADDAKHRDVSSALVSSPRAAGTGTANSGVGLGSGAAARLKFHLVGVSMGGMISLEFATRFPHLLASLMLINTHCGGMQSLVGSVRALGPIVKWTLCRLTATTMEQRIKAAMTLLYGDSVRKQPDKWKSLEVHNIGRVRSTLAQSKLGLISHVAAVGSHYVSPARLELLRASGVPVTICVGTRDVLIRPSNSFWLRSLLRCTLHVFEGEGHGLLGEVSDRFNAILIHHLRTAAAAAAASGGGASTVTATANGTDSALLQSLLHNPHVPAKYFHRAVHLDEHDFAKKNWIRRYSFVIATAAVLYVLFGIRAWFSLRRLAAASAAAKVVSTAAAGTSTAAAGTSTAAVPVLQSGLTSALSVSVVPLFIRWMTTVSSHYRNAQALWYYPLHAILNGIAERLTKSTLTAS